MTGGRVLDPAKVTKTLPARAGTSLAKLVRAEPGLNVLLFAKGKARTRVSVHLVRALRENGHRVTWLRSPRIRQWLGRRGASLYMRWRYRTLRPDLVIIYSRDVPAEVLESMAGTPRLIYFEDLPKQLENLPESWLRIFRGSTIMFTTGRGIVPILERQGVPRASFLHGGCDPTDHHPAPKDPAFESDVAFIGRPSTEDRLHLLRTLYQQFDTKLYGSGWKQALGVEPACDEVFPVQYRKICASARVVVGIDERDDVELYFSNRTWLTLGCGGFLLTRYVPCLEEYFTNHRHLVWYRDAEECAELIRYYLAHEEARAAVAAEGCSYVHEHHTFRHATAEMIRQAGPYLSRDA